MTDEREAFEAWFKAVEEGDGEIPLPTPADGKRWDEYVLRHALAWGAWQARAALPQQAQETSLPPQGAEPLAYRLISSGPNAGRVKPEYVRAALAASPAPAPQEPAARFLLVAMDDDGCGNPVFCADEKAVRAALAPLLFFFNEEHPLDAEDEASIDAHLESLLEDGFLGFEGDPGITLYKLHASPAPGELGAVDASAAESDLAPKVHRLLWGEHPECCGSPVEDTGAEYMGRVERVLSCCGSPDYVRLNDAQIVASLRALLPESPLTQQAPSERSAQGSGGEKA